MEGVLGFFMPPANRRGDRKVARMGPKRKVMAGPFPTFSQTEPVHLSAVSRPVMIWCSR